MGVRPDNSQDEQDKPQGKKRVDLSVPQVAGSAVAAVVAAKLASSFGVYGTILGAGVVSALATCGGTVFQHFFSRTGEQIRDVAVQTKPKGRQVPVTSEGRPVPRTFRSDASMDATKAMATGARPPVARPATGALPTTTTWGTPGAADAGAAALSHGPDDEDMTHLLDTGGVADLFPDDTGRTRLSAATDPDRTQLMGTADPEGTQLLGAVDPDGTRPAGTTDPDGTQLLGPDGRPQGAADPERTQFLGTVDPGRTQLLGTADPERTQYLGAADPDRTQLLQAGAADDTTRMLRPAATTGLPHQTTPGDEEFTEGTVHTVRVKRWKKPLIAAAVVFGVTMGGITTYELVAGHSFSGDSGSTTFRDAFSGHKSSGDSDPAPSTTPEPSDGSGTGSESGTPQEGGDPATDGNSTPTPTPSTSGGSQTGTDPGSDPDDGDGADSGGDSGDGKATPTPTPTPTPSGSAGSETGTGPGAGSGRQSPAE
ncbi:hypothetical protein [Streptomyces sp. NPDC049813]|uniref:hypothetical protein n=1 Tax=Streptomyces sp. NPDC049813 TaxID=3365597 RepID=UPI0037B57BFF